MISENMSIKTQENKKISSKKNKIINGLLIAGIIIYPLLLVWQGIDFTDEGFNLTNYQQIFNDPHCIALQFSCWFSNVLGGIWLYFFGKFGLLGVRIGGTIIVWITIYFSYKILKKDIKKEYLLFGLFLTLAFSDTYLNIIHYDNVTALLYIITIYLMIKSTEENSSYIYLAGVVTSLNVFTRISNIMAILLIIPLLIYNHFNGKEHKYQTKLVLDYLIGLGAVSILVLLIMKVIGHYDLYLRSIFDVFKLGNNNNNTHSLKKLIVSYWMDNYQLILYGAGFLVILLAVSKLLYFAKKKILLIIFSLGTTAFILFLVPNSYTSLLGMSLIIPFGYLILEHNNHRLKLIASMGCLFSIFIQAGSNVPSAVLLYGLWLVCPITISIILNLFKNNNEICFKFDFQNTEKRYLFSPSSQKFFSIVILITFSITAFYTGYKGAYRDSENRTKMTYKINNDKVNGVFTTKEKANAINELLPNLQRYVKKGDYLIAGDALSTLYYMTETKPYLYNTWTALESFNYGFAFSKALNENKYLPVIIIQNVNTGDRNWPQASNKGTSSYGMSSTNMKVLDAVIKEYNYKSVWKSEYFEIFVPESKIKTH